MTKDQADKVKKYIDKITGGFCKKTFQSKIGTLHITLFQYYDNQKDDGWISYKLRERKNVIEQISKQFPDCKVEENNKRYQGFINLICITVH